MAKRLSEKEKIKIVESFTLGVTIDELSKIFNCTKLTISRNLKKNLGEKKFKELISDNKTLNESFDNKEKNISIEKKIHYQKNISKKESTSMGMIKGDLGQELSLNETFMEIAPLDFDIDNNLQKDLSSVPISEANFPKIVYMVVDKKIELVIKNLKDYPDWNFLSESELKRKTIEIYNDLKIAKRFCNKEQKVIKVPNPSVFKMVSSILLARGISRIINDDQLIAL